MGKLEMAAKFYGHCVARTVEAAGITGTFSVFTITGGPITIFNLGVWVSTAIPSGANTLKFQLTAAGGSAIDLCGATDTASAGLNQLFVVNGTKGTALVKTTDVGQLMAGQTLTSTMPIMVVPGVIKAVFSGGPPATGAIQIFMEYAPASHFAQVQINQ